MMYSCKNMFRLMCVCMLSLVLSVSLFAAAGPIALESTVETSPARVTLTWGEQSATDFIVARRLEGSVGGGTWTVLQSAIPTTQRSYVDTSMVAGITYEYKLYSESANIGACTNCGIDIALVESQGTVEITAATVTGTVTGGVNPSVTAGGVDAVMTSNAWVADVPLDNSASQTMSIIGQSDPATDSGNTATIHIVIEQNDAPVGGNQ